MLIDPAMLIDPYLLPRTGQVRRQDAEPVTVEDVLLAEGRSCTRVEQDALGGSRPAPGGIQVPQVRREAVQVQGLDLLLQVAVGDKAIRVLAFDHDCSRRVVS